MRHKHLVFYSNCHSKQSARRPHFSCPRGSYVYTIGILYRQISIWQTKQLVNSSQRYVSTKLVRRLLSQKLTIFLSICHHFKVLYRKLCVRALVVLPAVAPFSTNFRIFEHTLTRLGWTQDSVHCFSAIVSTVLLI